MSKKRRKPAVQKRSTVSFLLDDSQYQILCNSGYTRLDRNPEVVTACLQIADIISSLTIYLMSNTEKGDKRIKNELSRKLDISPNRFMTRKTWMTAVVMNLLLYGRGNSVVLPRTQNGLLDDLVIIPPAKVSFKSDGGYGYKVLINNVEYDPSELLHFVHNPDEDYPWKGKGFTTTIKDVVKNLSQARATECAFMESKWKPSVIVKVDALTDEFSSPEGRKKLLDEYISTNNVGEPWMIPAENFAVEQIKPLTLSDLAINDTVQLDKKTVAGIIGVPPFVLGVGDYKKEEWDKFINTTVKSVVKIIEQEMTNKIILSDKWYVKMNLSSAYSYDLKTIADVYSGLYVKGLATGNEVRDKISMSPLDGLDNLTILENYIPLDKIGDQLKLKQEE
ncbi:MAG: phage portal protein [Lachnospiraceae bacterium]|nr:phage portal protein [Lachnospiraceae bacterium]